MGSSGKMVVIDDAYEDARFHKAMDAKLGYRTRSLLTVPVTGTNGRGTVLAVIQLINKITFSGQFGKFDSEDEQVAQTLAIFVASRLEAQTYTLVPGQPALPSGVGSASPTS